MKTKMNYMITVLTFCLSVTLNAEKIPYFSYGHDTGDVSDLSTMFKKHLEGIEFENLDSHDYDDTKIKSVLDENSVVLVYGYESSNTTARMKSHLKEFVESGGTLIVFTDKIELLKNAGLMDASYYDYYSSHLLLKPNKPDHPIFEGIDTSNLRAPYYIFTYRLNDKDAVSLASRDSYSDQHGIIYKQVGLGQVYLFGFIYNRFNEQYDLQNTKLVINAIQTGFSYINRCNPKLDVDLKNNQIKPGQSLDISLMIQHPCDQNREVEMRSWLITPDRTLRKIENESYFITLFPQEEFTLNSNISLLSTDPQGYYSLGYRFLDIYTGKTLSKKVVRFKVTP